MYYVCRKTSLNRPIMGPSLNGPIREVGGLGGLEYRYNGIIRAVVWDPSEDIDMVEWSICGGGRVG